MKYVAIDPESERHVMAVARALFDHEPRNGAKRFEDAARTTQDRYADKAAWVLSNASQSIILREGKPEPAPDANLKGAAIGSLAIEALRPFAKRAKALEAKWAARHPRYPLADAARYDVRLGDLRRAAEVLKLAEPETNT